MDGASRPANNSEFEVCVGSFAVTIDSLNSGIGLIRSYGAVAVLGAGVSMVSYPMTTQLTAMLAHAFDSNLDDRKELARRLNKADAPAKRLLIDDSSTQVGWSIAHQVGSTRATFQAATAHHDLDREPGAAHKALARLIHAGVLRYVISFNWDTAIERAYEQYFGLSIPDGVLVKPHGDAARPDESWVLPFQDEVIPESLIERVEQLKAAGPHVLLIAGYSSSDPVVVRDLIAPTESSWPTRRVSPSASGHEGIPGTAEVVLPAIADALGAAVDIPGWLRVTFRRSRDIGAALLGYKLGPQDVDACPQLPAAAAAARHLHTAGFAVITGDAGGGKSLAAFQAGRILNRQGWEVIELASQGVASIDDVRTFSESTGQVLAIVDDSQALDPAVSSAFERSASSDHAVLMVSTVGTNHRAQSTIHPAQAIATIREFCLDNEDLVSPFVSAADDRVGNGPLSESFGRRVEASGHATMPWEFMFTLGGGERRVGSSIDDLADTDDGALLLGLVAATEILTLDVGTTSDRLGEISSHVGKDTAWATAELGQLVDRHLASIRDGRVRTPHIRLAQEALLELCRRTAGEHWGPLADFLARSLSDPNESLQGRLWLSSTLTRSPLIQSHRHRIFPDSAANAVMDEIESATAGTDRRIAGSMIGQLGRWSAITDELADRIQHTLVRWLPEMTSDEVYGTYEAYMALSGKTEHIRQVMLALDPEAMAAVVSSQVDLRYGHEWGWLLLWLSQDDHPAAETWISRFAAALDSDELVERVAADANGRVAAAVDFIHSLGHLAPSAAAACIRAVTPQVVDLIEHDLPTAAGALWDWCFLEIPAAAVIYNPTSSDDSDFDWDDHPLRIDADELAWLEIAEAIRDLVRSVDWAAAGRSVASTGAYLHTLAGIGALGSAISQLAPELWSTATAAIDLDHLDKISEGEWATAEQVERLAYTMTEGADPGPGRRWIRRHVDGLAQVPPFIALADPELAAELHHDGRRILLPDRVHSSTSAKLIRAMADLDPGVAAELVQDVADQLLAALQADPRRSSRDLADLIRVIDDVDGTNRVDELIAELELRDARAAWTELASDSGPSAPSAKFLLVRTEPQQPA